MLAAILFCGLSLANVSCSEADNPSGQQDPVKPEEGFFTSEINALIDANYPEVIANGYAELIIPSTMFDPSIMRYADYCKETITVGSTTTTLPRVLATAVSGAPMNITASMASSTTLCSG